MLAAIAMSLATRSRMRSFAKPAKTNPASTEANTRAMQLITADVATRSRRSTTDVWRGKTIYTGKPSIIRFSQ